MTHAEAVALKKFGPAVLGQAEWQEVQAALKNPGGMGPAILGGPRTSPEVFVTPRDKPKVRPTAEEKSPVRNRKE